jgi:succinate-semialdehyde dehydrogenase/glutarate-semialdehyde dehydrogenase
MGKPLSQARDEIEKCAWVCDYYGEHAEAFLQDYVVEMEEYQDARVKCRPLGLLFAVMPWNFPFWQVFRAAVPAISGGNATVVKPASNVPDSALTIEALFQEAGFPRDLFRVILTNPGNAAVAIVNPAVRAVSLTGSTKAGQTIAAQAGTQVKKTVLELGGNDPYIVLADADLDQAAETLVAGRLQNCGQSCIAVKRVIVETAVAEDLELRLAAALQKHQPADPFAGSTSLGPLARKDLRDELEQQIRDSVNAGAKIVCGGKRQGQQGWFFEPTLLKNVEPGMPVFDEEVFGPALSLSTAADEEEALALANQSIYGLGAGVFSADTERAQRLADRLQAGQVFINDFVKSDPRLPFGGTKQSGHGREMGPYGIREFINIQTRVVR